MRSRIIQSHNITKPTNVPIITGTTARAYCSHTHKCSEQWVKLFRRAHRVLDIGRSLDPLGSALRDLLVSAACRTYCTGSDHHRRCATWTKICFHIFYIQVGI